MVSAKKQRELDEKRDASADATKKLGESPKLIESMEAFRQGIDELKLAKGKPTNTIENVKAIKCVEDPMNKRTGWDKCAIFNTKNEVQTYEGVHNVLLDSHQVSRFFSNDQVMYIEFKNPQSVILHHKTPLISDTKVEDLDLARTPKEKERMVDLKERVDQIADFTSNNTIKNDPSLKAELKTTWFDEKEKSREIAKRNKSDPLGETTKAEAERIVEELFAKMNKKEDKSDDQPDPSI